MARKDDKLEHLAQVRLFGNCSKKELQLIAKRSDEISVPAGRELVKQGTSGHEFYLILEGTAKVVKGGRKTATLGPGQYFGELALLDRGLRSASVVAEGDMRLLILGQREFLGLIDEVPAIAHKLLATMAGRLREADARSAATH